MKKLIGVLALSALVGAASSYSAQENPKPATPPEAAAPAATSLKSSKEKVSYSIGVNFARSLRQAGIEVDADVLARGMKDAISGAGMLMTDQEMRETMANLQQEMVNKQMARMKELAEKNRKAGEAFLAENARKEGVVTLPSGLQYKSLREGTGKTPKAGDIVTVNYRGTLIDSTEFDSSYRRNEPATFRVNEVIPGWTEALQLMKVGSKWQLFIPPHLAYGEAGAANIEPNSTLIFEVELLGIQENPEKK